MLTSGEAAGMWAGRNPPPRNSVSTLADVWAGKAGRRRSCRRGGAAALLSGAVLDLEHTSRGWIVRLSLEVFRSSQSSMPRQIPYFPLRYQIPKHCTHLPSAFPFSPLPRPTPSFVFSSFRFWYCEEATFSPPSS